MEIVAVEPTAAASLTTAARARRARTTRTAKPRQAPLFAWTAVQAITKVGSLIKLKHI